MNHNIMEKISIKYIEEKIRQEENKIYAYVLLDLAGEVYNQRGDMDPRIIKANSKRDLYLKIFNQDIGILLEEFILRYASDLDITKYLDSDVNPMNPEELEYLVQLDQDFYDKIWREKIKDDMYVEDKIYEFVDLLEKNQGQGYIDRYEDTMGYGLSITKMH